MSLTEEQRFLLMRKLPLTPNEQVVYDRLLDLNIYHIKNNYACVFQLNDDDNKIIFKDEREYNDPAMLYISAERFNNYILSHLENKG